MHVAVDVYKQALPKPKGMMNYFNHQGASNSMTKSKPRKYPDTGSNFHIIHKL